MARSMSRAITPFSLASLLALSAGQALGQNFNIDLNNTSGNGAGVPASAYGGAAGQPGFWNSITSAVAPTSTLKDLNGNNSSVTFTRDTVGTFNGAHDVGVSGDTAKLIEDYQSLPSFGTLTYSFNNLSFGTYAVYTYAAMPNGGGNTSGVTVTNTSSAYQYVGANALSGSKLIPGTTHAIHVVQVNAGGSITVKVSDSFSGTAHVGGFQLVRINSTPIRFYVNDNSPSDLDGTGWATAYHDLQVPLQAAANIGGTYCEVWVSQGFYYPTTGTSRSATFKIPSGISLYGGFAGTETSLTQRTNPWIYITALSGSIGGSAQTDNVYHVVDANDTAANTLIDGFSIARGYANGSGNDSRGGGMTAINGSINCFNVKFLSNYASVDGGGVLATGGNPTFLNSLFYDNWTSGSGGAIYHHTSGTVECANTEFLNNRAVGDGGAIKLLFADASVDGCAFDGNTASSGNGGAINVSGDTGVGLSLRMSTLASNVANAGAAGGIYITGGTDATMTNSILWNNTDGVPNTVSDAQYTAVTGQGSFMTAINDTVQGQNPDPLFVNMLGNDGIPGNFDDDLHLSTFSPCIDVGNNNFVPQDNYDTDGDFNWLEKWGADIDGNPRFVDVPWAANLGVGTGAIVDRGAYEFQYTPCPSDFDGDGFVTGDDFDAFVAAFELGQISSDFNKDGFVTGDDFDAFVAAFESGC